MSKEPTKPETKRTVTPYVWKVGQDDRDPNLNTLEPQNSIYGDKNRISKDCHLTMDSDTLKRLKILIQNKVLTQLKQYTEDSSQKDKVLIDTLKKSINSLGTKTQSINTQSNELHNKVTDQNNLKQFSRSNSSSGTQLIADLKNKKKLLKNELDLLGKQLDDIDTKMNVFVKGDTTILSSNKDFKRLKKEEYLDKIYAKEGNYKGKLYVTKMFGKTAVSDNATIEWIYPKKKEYLVIYEDSNGKEQRMTVKKICEEQPLN